MVKSWVANAILILAALVWLANFTFGVLLSDYRPSETINGVFLAIIGGIFALRGRKDDDHDQH